MTSPGPCCLMEIPGVLDADHWHLEPRIPTSSSEGNPRGRGMETGVSIKDYPNSDSTQVTRKESGSPLSLLAKSYC